MDLARSVVALWRRPRRGRRPARSTESSASDGRAESFHSPAALRSRSTTSILTNGGGIAAVRSLREDTKGATVAFRHDVLRDWAVGFLIHEDGELLSALPMNKPLPPGLARGLEIAARLALESDATGARWSALLAAVERDGCSRKLEAPGAAGVAALRTGVHAVSWA